MRGRVVELVDMGVNAGLAMVVPIVGAIAAVVLSCVLGRIVTALY